MLGATYRGYLQHALDKVEAARLGSQGRRGLQDWWRRVGGGGDCRYPVGWGGGWRGGGNLEAANSGFSLSETAGVFMLKVSAAASQVLLKAYHLLLPLLRCTQNLQHRHI